MSTLESGHTSTCWQLVGIINIQLCFTYGDSHDSVAFECLLSGMSRAAWLVPIRFKWMDHGRVVSTLDKAVAGEYVSLRFGDPWFEAGLRLMNQFAFLCCQCTDTYLSHTKWYIYDIYGYMYNIYIRIITNVTPNSSCCSSSFHNSNLLC